MSTLIEEWKNFSSKKSLKLFEGDIEIFNKTVFNKFSCNYKNFADYSKKFSLWQKESLFHLGLLPVPYTGNLENACIFILLLNPGLKPVDYYAESYSKDFRNSRLSSIHQQNQDPEYPFHYLNPKYSWHSGANYWNTRLSSIIFHIYKHRKINYIDAVKYLSKNIATIELVPYHSETFPKLSMKIVNQFKSVQLVKEYVHEVLVPKANSGKCILIVTRSNKYWNLKNRPQKKYCLRRCRM